MSIFQKVELEWHGKKHTIPADRVLGAIAEVEQHVTFPELASALRTGKKLPMATIASGYGAALRYAGADVSNEDVYLGMFSGEDAQAAIVDSTMTLLVMMVPPEKFAAAGITQKAPAGNVKAAANSKASKRSSKRR